MPSVGLIQIGLVWTCKLTAMYCLGKCRLISRPHTHTTIQPKQFRKMPSSIFSPRVINNNHCMFFLNLEIIFSAILKAHHSLFIPHLLFLILISLVHQKAERNRVCVGGVAMLIKQCKKKKSALLGMHAVGRAIVL